MSNTAVPFPLKYRRLRGDMIAAFNILNHYSDSNVASNLILNRLQLQEDVV